jgi:hypothetical protein
MVLYLTNSGIAGLNRIRGGMAISHFAVLLCYTKAQTLPMADAQYKVSGKC